MTPDQIETLFTAADGGYRFARWGRPISPVIFGVEDQTIATLKGAIEAMSVLTGHPLSETDPELGSNLMIFFFRDWDELLAVPGLDGLVPGLGELVPRLTAEGATQYRGFRFDEAGAIKACFSFVRMGGGMEDLPAETIALGQAAEAMLTWDARAFAAQSPMALHPESGETILRPEIAGVIRAAYDPVMPAAADDPSHALRLFARMNAGGAS